MSVPRMKGESHLRPPFRRQRLIAVAQIPVGGIEANSLYALEHFTGLQLWNRSILIAFLKEKGPEHEGIFTLNSSMWGLTFAALALVIPWCFADAYFAK
jgi:hypothetical protein